MMEKRINTGYVMACLAISLLFALVLGVSAAFAAEVGDYPEDGTNTLTVAPIGKVEEAIETDIAGADVIVDVYQIGIATPRDDVYAYDYKLVAPFDTLTFFDPDKATASSWIDLAEGSAKLVTADMQHLTVAADGITELDLPADGLYLVLPHGNDCAVAYGDDVIASLVATGKDYRYSFSPSIIAAPTKDAPEGHSATTDGPGSWTRAISITIKPECKPIDNPPSPPNPDNPDKPDEPDNPDNPDEPDKPSDQVKTGDVLAIAPFAVAAAVSAIVLIALIVIFVRRRNR